MYSIGLLTISLLLGAGIFSSQIISKGDHISKEQVQKIQEEKTSNFRVTLLGTGSPLLSMERFGPATLVELGMKDYFLMQAEELHYG